MNAGLCSTTGHRVEAAASPHTTAASIISLLIIMTPCHTKYCIQVTCNCALRKFIYVFEPPNQNTHLFVCTIHILVMLAPDPTRATTPASAGPLLASGSNHSRYYLSGSCGPASPAGCPAVLQCPGHPHILYLVSISCLHAEKCGTLVNILCTMSAPCLLALAGHSSCAVLRLAAARPVAGVRASQ